MHPTTNNNNATIIAVGRCIAESGALQGIKGARWNGARVTLVELFFSKLVHERVVNVIRRVFFFYFRVKVTFLGFLLLFCSFFEKNKSNSFFSPFNKKLPELTKNTKASNNRKLTPKKSDVSTQMLFWSIAHQTTGDCGVAGSLWSREKPDSMCVCVCLFVCVYGEEPRHINNTCDQEI